MQELTIGLYCWQVGYLEVAVVRMALVSGVQAWHSHWPLWPVCWYVLGASFGATSDEDWLISTDRNIFFFLTWLFSVSSVVNALYWKLICSKQILLFLPAPIYPLTSFHVPFPHLTSFYLLLILSYLDSWAVGQVMDPCPWIHMSS